MFEIETQNLTKNYGRLVAVDGLDLQIAKEAIFGFLGPNGAGKSTTVGMLTGLLRPSSARTSFACRWKSRCSFSVFQLKRFDRGINCRIDVWQSAGLGRDLLFPSCGQGALWRTALVLLVSLSLYLAMFARSSAGFEQKQHRALTAIS